MATGNAVVMIASELCEEVRSGIDVQFDDLDVITSGTCGFDFFCYPRSRSAILQKKSIRILWWFEAAATKESCAQPNSLNSG